MASEPVLSAAERAFLAAARRAVMVTIAPDGRPRPVPVCFVLDEIDAVLYTPIDDKPKRNDGPRSLARVRDIERDPRVSVLVDRWDEDWANLAWVRCLGTATIEPSGADFPEIIRALRAKYSQYADHGLEARPLIRIAIERVTAWGLTDANA
ncbi:MAG: TIGR03668 family PPOX class F420-dependent oxidoreductase [Chloroflexota bacterium]